MLCFVQVELQDGSPAVAEHVLSFVAENPRAWVFHTTQVRLVCVEVRWSVCQEHINASVQESLECLLFGV